MFDHTSLSKANTGFDPLQPTCCNKHLHNPLPEPVEGNIQESGFDPLSLRAETSTCTTRCLSPSKATHKNPASTRFSLRAATNTCTIRCLSPSKAIYKNPASTRSACVLQHQPAQPVACRRQHARNRLRLTQSTCLIFMNHNIG